MASAAIVAGDVTAPPRAGEGAARRQTEGAQLARPTFSRYRLLGALIEFRLADLICSVYFSTCQ